MLTCSGTLCSGSTEQTAVHHEKAEWMLWNGGFPENADERGTKKHKCRQTKENATSWVDFGKKRSK